VPDWLSGVGTIEDEEEAAPAPSFTAGMFGTDDDEDDADALGDFDFTLDDEDDEAVAAAVPDWLSSVGSVEDKTEVEPVSNFAAGRFGSDDDDDEDADALGDFDLDLDEEDEIEAETAPDWLAAVAPTDTTPTDRLQEREMATSAASLFDDEDEDALDFSWETDDEAETPPDWLAGVGTTSAADDELEPDTEAVPDWLNSLDENDAEDKIAAAAAYDAGLEADFADDEPVGTLAEALAPTPASNAPDWLNAMVPGLDVDYADDDDSEPDAEPAAPAARQGSDFTWLTTIVNEELAPPVSMPEKLGQSPIRQAASRAMKYAFSRPPSWLRRLRGETEAAPALTGESLDEDDDLPPWLQFDGDDSQ
jgi:hypothetical protein